MLIFIYMELKNKTILITGSSQGIGKAAALEFAKHGSNLIITYNKNKKGAEETAEQCRNLGVKADYFKLNVSDENSIKKFVEDIKEKNLEIDVLVNNAGIAVWKNLDNQTNAEIENQINANLTGLIKMTKYFLDDIEKNSGFIVNISSGAGKYGYSNLPVYCATKFGVRGFTQALSSGLKNAKICSVNPGITKTQMTGYSGVSPQKVAEVIVKSVSGEIKPDEKLDVDVWKFV